MIYKDYIPKFNTHLDFLNWWELWMWLSWTLPNCYPLLFTKNTFQRTSSRSIEKYHMSTLKAQSKEGDWLTQTGTFTINSKSIIETIT